MVERLLKIRARDEASETPDSPATPRKRARLVRDALHAARSVLPRRGETVASEKLVLLALGLVAVLVTTIPIALSSHTIFRAWIEHTDLAFGLPFGVLGALGPFLVSAAFTFVFSIAFLILTRGSQSRLRQALVCPYCRDEVEQEGTLACARRGCGALYHRECWEECAVQYGGCAIYGCSSKKAREVNAAAYVLRLSRLVLAAILFPPRVARAIRHHRGDAFSAVFTRSLEQARSWHGLANASSTRQFVVTLLLGLPLAIGSSVALFDDRHGIFRKQIRHHEIAIPIVVYALFFSLPFALLALPFVVALFASVFFYGAKAISAVLANEVSALARADEGGGSVLGRLRAGLGGKKDCC